MSVERELAARGEAVGDGLDDLADQRDVVGLERERVEHRVHATLERVLDRRERPLARPSWTDSTTSRSDASGTPSSSGAAALSASSLTVPGGPR